MAKLDLDWLHVFVEIYKTQSVSRAADRLGMAQANASIALNKLRTYFGDRLFCRTARGMEPTPYAQQIYPELFAAANRLTTMVAPRPAFEAATARREFRICMTDISEIVILPMLINRLRQIAPGVQIEAERISTESPRRLESGEIDLAVGFMPHLEAGFYQQTLFEQDFVCLVAHDHPRIGARLPKREFIAEGHIVVTTSGTGHAIVEKVLARRGVRRHVVLKLPSYLGVARIVAETELVAIAPRRLGETVSRTERVRIVPPPIVLPPFAVKQHWHERFHADAGNVWLRRTMGDLLTGFRSAAIRAPKSPA